MAQTRIARRYGDDSDDAYRHPGAAQRHGSNWMEKVSNEQ